MTAVIERSILMIDVYSMCPVGESVIQIQYYAVTMTEPWVNLLRLLLRFQHRVQHSQLSQTHVLGVLL
jgi:hypothetical protein